MGSGTKDGRIGLGVIAVRGLIEAAGGGITNLAAGALAADCEWFPATHVHADSAETDATPSLAAREADPVLPAHTNLFALSPGMQAEIHFRTGDRSLPNYLFKPLTEYSSRALREQ